MDLRDAVFNTIYELASKNKDVIVLTDDMGALVLDKIQNDFPTQVVNVGIAEQNLMSVAGGLALAGKSVFAYGIMSHITRRCYEQIALDICSMDLPVVIIGVGSGLSYGWDGLTHHSNYDLAYMRAIPGIAIYNPCDHISASKVVRIAYDGHSPAFIRLDKNQPEPIYHESDTFEKGLAKLVEGKGVALVASGMMVQKAIEISRALKVKGISVRVIDLYRIKPCNKPALVKAIRGVRVTATLEEQSEVGGIGDLVSSLVAEHGLRTNFAKFSLGDQFFLGSANREWVHEKCGLTVASVASRLIKEFKGSNKRAS